MAVLTHSDRADMDRSFGLLLTLHRDRALSTGDAKALLTKFVEEVDIQDAKAAQHLWSAVTAIGGDSA